MNRRIHFKPIASPYPIGLALAAVAWFGFLPIAQAVVPAPDGGYAGGNTAEGDNALLGLIPGGRYNTAVGLNALYTDTTGSRNTAIGVNALRYNISGDSNTAVGVNALYINTGGLNTAVGDSALFNNISYYNTATGFEALYNNSTGDFDVATGISALYHNTTGFYNTASGSHALFSNTIGNGNTATGLAALYSNTTGFDNTATGLDALYSNTTGFRNTANGSVALNSNTTGSGNIALGYRAGSNTTGSNNIDIGNSGVYGESATIRIGEANTHTEAFIAGIYGVTVAYGTPVYMKFDGQLGTRTSSARFKDEIKPMDRASEAILTLKPVTFRYNKEIDPDAIPQFGLVAEEVEKINPDLVIRDTEGKPFTVRYDAVNAMLLNEFLKEHRKVQQLEANAAQQQKQIEALTAGLQKVSAQLARGESVRLADFR